MLSVLIPTYRYDVSGLAAEIGRQATAAGIAHEILCLDDGSGAFLSENQTINDVPNASFTALEQNIGRSAIRNLLARKATYPNLLFLDADVLPIGSDFIQHYIPYLNGGDRIVYGGIRYQEERPAREQLLRWVYGNQREALPVYKRVKNPHLTFLTLNFLATKTTLDRVGFNEAIPNLRHEDTLFSYDLSRAGIPVVHIDNPVWHLGLEDGARFLQKSEEAVQALDHLVAKGLLPEEYAALSRFHRKIKQYRLEGLVASTFRIGRHAMKKQLLGPSPSMRLFDLYRLGYLCTLKRN